MWIFQFNPDHPPANPALLYAFFQEHSLQMGIKRAYEKTLSGFLEP
jgi:hypothetical protein